MYLLRLEVYLYCIIYCLLDKEYPVYLSSKRDSVGESAIRIFSRLMTRQTSQQTGSTDQEILDELFILFDVDSKCKDKKKESYKSHMPETCYQ